MISQIKKKKRWAKNMILKIYLLKVTQSFIESKKEDEKKSKLQLEKTIAERVKLRRQKANDEDLSHTPSLEGDHSDEFIDIPDIPPLEGDEEEVKEGKGLKILTPNKLLTRLPILLAQIKAGNNPYNLKNEIRQILHLLYQHNKIIKKIYNN